MAYNKWTLCWESEARRDLDRSQCCNCHISRERVIPSLAILIMLCCVCGLNYAGEFASVPTTQRWAYAKQKQEHHSSQIQTLTAAKPASFRATLSTQGTMIVCCSACGLLLVFHTCGWCSFNELNVIQFLFLFSDLNSGSDSLVCQPYHPVYCVTPKQIHMVLWQRQNYSTGKC